MLHSNAWKQGVILVLNEETKVTSDIEERLGASDPSLEANIFTFNDLNAVTDFSKNRKDITLCIFPDRFTEVS